MTSTTKSNWYIYTDDIHGCHGIYSGLQSPDDVIIELTLGRLGVFINESFDDDGKKEWVETMNEFRSAELDNISFGKRIEMILKANKADISTLYVDDFDNLCLGKSNFSVMAIQEFCDYNEHEPMSFVAAELNVEFLDFVEKWVISIWS